MSLVAVAMNFVVVTFVQYAGLFTVRHVGWSTRKQVEVGLSTAQAPADATPSETQLTTT